MKYYLVDRIYKEDSEYVKNGGNDSRYYGWTNSKKLLDLFFKQRTRSKYDVFKYTEEEINNNRDLKACVDEKYEIDIIKLPSVKHHGKKVKLLTTKREVDESIRSIKDMVSDMSSLLRRNYDKKGDSCERMIDVFNALKDEYKDALAAVGFIPPEITSMYDDVDDPYNSSRENLPVYHALYTLETFVKVMYEDL